jgi:hypothetical protein
MFYFILFFSIFLLHISLLHVIYYFIIYIYPRRQLELNSTSEPVRYGKYVSIKVCIKVLVTKIKKLAGNKT